MGALQEEQIGAPDMVDYNTLLYIILLLQDDMLYNFVLKKKLIIVMQNEEKWKLGQNWSDDMGAASVVNQSN
jgi:hypothetical protein